MNVICSNPKNYSLTQNRTYRVIEETRDMYIILNDNNSRKRYSKRLFRLEEEVADIPQTPTQPQPVVLSFTTHVTEDDRNIEIVVSDQNGETVFEFSIANIGLNIHDNHTSCGIKDIDDINSIVGCFNDFNRDVIAPNWVEAYSGSGRLDTENIRQVKEGIKGAFLNIVQDEVVFDLEDHSFAFLVASTTSSHKEFFQNNAVFNKVGSVDFISDTKENPNSGNDIFVMIITKTDDN